MTRSGVIINPRSGRGRGKGLALASALRAENAPADVCVLDDFAALIPSLERMASNRVENLFISSGDGTVQAIQTWLAEKKAFAKMPSLCLLPHGTTNMTAADLGFQRRNIADQASFISNPTAQQTRSRHTIRVANPRHGQAQHGMFFGIGAVSEATRYCQVAFNDKGVGGNWATFATLATVAGKSIFLAPNSSDPNRFDKPYDITLDVDGERLCQGPQLLMFATTLDKLILHARPFWGGVAAPIRTTVIPYPVPSIPRWIWPIMYGREQRTVPPGAVSRSCLNCEVTSPTPFVIDGEFHDSPLHEPLRLETGPKFEYLIA